MILYIDSDAAYIILPNARSRYAGHFYLSNKATSTSCPRPPCNGPIHTECKSIRSVVASAAEAETTGVFGNSIPICPALEALDHPQPPTPIKTDNSTAYGLSMQIFAKNTQKLGTCGSIGCMIGPPKKNYSSIGTRARTTMLTIT